MEKVISNIKSNQQLRSSLIELKAKTDGHEQCFYDKELYAVLISYLKDEDPKVRKNSALLLGMFHESNVVEVLLNHYEEETIEYVKEAYLKGCLNHDCHQWIHTLEKIQKDLMANSNEAEAKHLSSQLKLINLLVLQNQHHRAKMLHMKHEYIDVILTTIPWYQFTLFEGLKGYKYKPVGQGVLVRTNSLFEIKNLRSFEEILIPLSGCVSMNKDAKEITDKLYKSNLKYILNVLYETNEPFYFKVNDRLKVKDGKLMKNVADKLSILFPDFLLNSPHQYEIEIVLKELKPSVVNAYLRVMDIENRRFQYRKDASSFSMKPFLAATLMKLAEPYLVNYSRILDPFCGSGTLLIERNIVKHTHFAMGLDIYGKGLDIAKKNVKSAGQNVHFVHKDALRFVNNEPFDEIFTDMPTKDQTSDSEALKELYDKFFKRIPKLVKHDGYAFIYTSELALIRKNLRLNQKYLTLVEHYELVREKNMYYFFIIKVK